MNLTEVELDCPYCDETVSVMVDPISGHQSYTEDCSVCCRPMLVEVDADEEGNPEVKARREAD